jgi:alpha-mannosidase
MKNILCILIFIFSYTFSGYAQESLIVYPKPIKYEKTEGRLFTKAKIIYPGDKADLSVELNGKAIKYDIELDSLKVVLPLTGSKGLLEFKQKGRLVKSQAFFPYIPDDWNYFKNGTINIISSSHQDIAWMSTPDSCMTERIHKIILPAMELMEKNKGFKFGMEQSLNLRELIDMDPANVNKAIHAYQNGQFGWGATFNQPYEGIEADEQLVRQLYLGKKWLKEKFDGKIDAQTAFNVDVPGRTPQFPQILAKAGVKNLFISRFKEGFYNWYSPDGSKIFTYSPGNYGWAVIFYKYFDEDAPTAMHRLHEVLKNWNEYYASRNIPPHYAIVISNDAAGPIFYDKVLKDWNEIVAASGLEIPTLEYSTVDQFLGSVNVPAAKFDSISGERPDLWIYIHGPAHYEAIKAKRKASVHLPAAEIFATADALRRNSFADYPKTLFDSAWYYSIYPDHGWGGKHGDTTDAIFRAYLERGDLLAKQSLNKSLLSISSAIKTKFDSPVFVFNDLSWTRGGMSIVSLKDTASNYTVVDANGKATPSQIIKNKEGASLSFLTDAVPSVGYQTYYLQKKPTIANANHTVLSNSYENEFYSIQFGSGGIKSLFDKQLGKELLNTTRFAGGDILDLGYDGLDAGEFTQITAPNITNFDKMSNHPSAWTVTNDGNVFTTFENHNKINGVYFIQRITAYHQIKKIDFEYEVPDWKGVKNRQLTFAMPINTNAARIDYDVPMGVATVNKSELQSRPMGWAWGGTYWQKPEEIHPRESINFISANSKDFGVTVSSQIAAFDWIDPTREAVAYPVLQYVMMTSQKSCHGEGPWYYQKGKHVFNFSLTSHKPGWENGYAFGVESNHDFYTINGKKNNNGALPETQSFFSSSSPFTKITAIKKADDNNDVIVRIVNMQEQNNAIDFLSFKNANMVQEATLIEEATKKLSSNGKVLKLNMLKSSIQTFRISF